MYNFLLFKKCERVKVTQSCLILCNPMDCSPSGSSVLGILQARIMELVAIPPAQGIFPTQRANLSLPTLQEVSLPSEAGGKPFKKYSNAI